MRREYPGTPVVTPSPPRWATRRLCERSSGDHCVVADVEGPAVTPRRLRMRRPAVLAELRTIRRRVQQWALGHGLPDEVLVDLQLAVGEAVSNGMEHAYLHGRAPEAAVEVELELRTGGAGPVVAARVADYGKWRPQAAMPGYRGRGLALIARVSRDMRVSRTRAGTEVTFAIPVALTANA